VGCGEGEKWLETKWIDGSGQRKRVRLKRALSLRLLAHEEEEVAGSRLICLSNRMRLWEGIFGALKRA